MIELYEYREKIEALCSELGVISLDVFGSFNTPDFDDASDVDLVARFDRSKGRMFSRYFELKENLEKLFNRRVDLVLEDSIKNPYFREAIDRTRANIYGS